MKQFNHFLYVYLCMHLIIGMDGTGIEVEICPNQFRLLDSINCVNQPERSNHIDLNLQTELHLWSFSYLWFLELYSFSFMKGNIKILKVLQIPIKILEWRTLVNEGENFPRSREKFPDREKN